MSQLLRERKATPSPPPFPLQLFESESHFMVSDSLRPHGLYNPWNSPGQNTKVGSLSLLRGIIPTQVSNPGLPHCRQILYQLSHKGSPRTLEWVTYPFSSRSCQSRNWTGSPALQVDSLPTELSWKLNMRMVTYNPHIIPPFSLTTVWPQAVTSSEWTVEWHEHPLCCGWFF